MKKIMTIFKTMLMAAVVFVMAQGCVPTPVGGGPTPTNGFNINATVHPSSPFIPFILTPPAGAEKTVTVDGDVLSFSIRPSKYEIATGMLSFDYFSSYYCIMKINNESFAMGLYNYGYEIIGNQQFIDMTPSGFIGKLFDAGTLIDNSYSSTTNPIRLPAAIEDGFFLGEGSSFSPFSFSPFNTQMPFNIDKYIVLRKSKTTGYQYYWIKFRRTGVLGNETIEAVSGRYQMNSIITGQ